MSYYITLDREDIKSKIGINQNFQIFNEDCREGIKRLKDNSIDFIVTRHILLTEWEVNGMIRDYRIKLKNREL